MTETEAANLVVDIRRTLILGVYMRHWGMPEYRWISRREDHAIEVYSFPPRKDGVVHRFATIGVSAENRGDGTPANYELCMILPDELAGASADEVVSLMLDVAVHSYRKDVRCSVGATIPETPLMPAKWPPKALLFDELRGEPEELSHISVGDRCIELLWLVPIYGDEQELIKREGIDAFDLLDAQSDWSVADPRRPSLVSGRD
jgi:Suppressor of fused protein (SUFU)